MGFVKVYLKLSLRDDGKVNGRAPSSLLKLFNQCAFKNVILLSSCAYDLKEANEYQNQV